MILHSMAQDENSSLLSLSCTDFKDCVCVCVCVHSHVQLIVHTVIYMSFPSITFKSCFLKCVCSCVLRLVFKKRTHSYVNFDFHKVY